MLTELAFLYRDTTPSASLSLAVKPKGPQLGKGPQSPDYPKQFLLFMTMPFGILNGPAAGAFFTSRAPPEPQQKVFLMPADLCSA